MKRTFLISFLILSLLTACNKDWHFPDYKYTTVYFPYQSPERTLVLGEDIYDNTLDNAHKFIIMATMGGVYENKKNVVLNVSVDTSLTRNLKFTSTSGEDIVAMPDTYYSLPKDKVIVIPSGSIMGGIEVQLTDAFFADPRSIKNTFVLPMKILSVQNADSVLRGATTLSSADPRKAADWGTVPKDYVLYGVKYVNPYHGAYLRRGIDLVKGNNGNTGLDTTVVYHNTYVENDQVVSLFTKSLTQDTTALNAKTKGNINVPFQLTLQFDNNGKCSVSGPASASYTISGTGELVKKGDMWGNEKRDVLHLKYQVNFATTTHSFTDTLVLRDRAVKFETFTPIVTQ